MKSDFEKFREVINQSISVIDRSQRTEFTKIDIKNTIADFDDADSLLSRCEEITSKATRKARPKIRILHHFACSGGTIISKSIGALPNVFLLSEVHPTSTLHLGTGKPKYLPTDISSLVRYTNPPEFDSLAGNLFCSSIKVVNEHIEKYGGNVVLRDHTHADFCMGKICRKKSAVLEVLEDEFDILNLVTVRNPIDSFLSLSNNNWIHFTPGTFESYCKRYLIFISQFNQKQIIKYENFVAKPEKTIKKIANRLDLPFSDSFINTFPVIAVTGDSGRGGEYIEKRPRREISSLLAKEIKKSKSFKTLVKKLGYKTGVVE